MKVLFCTAEVHPFSRVGGLAEFSFHLPSKLAALGMDLTVISPLYRNVNRQAAPIEPMPEAPPADLQLGDEKYHVRYWRAILPGTSIPLLLVECDTFFGRDGIYTNPTDGLGFADNHRRFGFFQLAICHLIETGVLAPDLLHLNDHHTALMPALIRSRPGLPVRPRTLLTLHNIAFQGDCEESFAFDLGLSRDLFEPVGPYRRNTRLNSLKAGILFSDRVVAVSPTYANETRTNQDLGFGLCEELNQKGDAYSGVLNGIDYTQWNPATDSLIKQTYGPDSLPKKKINKEELLAINGLDAGGRIDDTPVLGMITRLTNPKGFDLLSSAIEKIMTFDLAFVMLGTGDPKYHRLFEAIKMRFPHKFGLNLTYSNRLARMILAGSDFFIMPSRFEPCGQHQMFAMRYGALPIVHATGGLADTVAPISDDAEKGVGFPFVGYDPSILLKTVWKAVSFYKDRKLFRKAVIRAMNIDFSWESTARTYLEHYRELVKDA